jgi:hypothetical protein
VKNIIFYVGYEDELSLALIRKIFSQLENNYLVPDRKAPKTFIHQVFYHISPREHQ